MKHIFWCVALGAFILFLLSCGAKKSQHQTRGSDEIAKVMIPESGCYASLTGGDSIWLKVEVFPNVVTGVLKYNISGKDKNTGTFYGKLYGDTLIADYSFYSEGRQSVRQVAFLIKDGSAVEGYGDIQEQNGKIVFNNVSSIDFSKGFNLQKISCADHDEQFRVEAVSHKR
ncbi:hypothetical protein DC498_08120 [Terrimonas sp.]|uniref:hypothetical protein n=1 Tax=Terrimonas sp. TaxID=1914338 RepID=UPI000D521B37|nr:hypothetical protein [Terrimonas sp.]PVD52877.1 hypothetical protein DC498_08120 [Terrimonas sp.]